METPLPDLNAAMDLDDEFPPTDLFAWILSGAFLLFLGKTSGLVSSVGSPNPHPPTQKPADLAGACLTNLQASF